MELACSPRVCVDSLQVRQDFERKLNWLLNRFFSSAGTKLTIFQGSLSDSQSLGIISIREWPNRPYIMGCACELGLPVSPNNH